MIFNTHRRIVAICVIPGFWPFDCLFLAMLCVFGPGILCVVIVHPAAATGVESGTDPRSSAAPCRYTAPRSAMLRLPIEAQLFTVIPFKGVATCSGAATYCCIAEFLTGAQLIVHIRSARGVSTHSNVVQFLTSEQLYTAARHCLSQGSSCLFL